MRGGHPWVFRGGVSTAASIFPDGQWLHLVDGHNKSVGYGIYSAEGVVAIRFLGAELPDARELDRRVKRALGRRDRLTAETTAVRLVNGESDGLPGVVMDRYGSVGVLQTYTSAVDSLGRYVAYRVRQRLGLNTVLWKMPRRRAGAVVEDRVLFGPPVRVVEFREGPLTLYADLAEGQKSGTFLDLRGLRREMLARDLKGKRVLNLFSYTGALGLACERAGASEVVNVDASQAALDFAREHHGGPAQQWVRQDLLGGDWSGVPEGPFDVIVADPPPMTSRGDQVERVLAAYRKLYRRCQERLLRGGLLVACCCTSRISEEKLRQVLDREVDNRFRRRLPPEADHRPGFPEADYLKVLLYG